METRKEGRESLLVMWVLPSPAAGALRWSLWLGMASSTVLVPELALVDAGSLAGAAASRPAGLASGKLQEELSGFSGRAEDRRALCPEAEGDRLMPPALAASAWAFGAVLPFPLASGQPLPAPAVGLSVRTGDRLASGLLLSAGA